MCRKLQWLIIIFLIGIVAVLGLQVQKNNDVLRNQSLLRNNMKEDFIYELAKLKTKIEELEEEKDYLKSRMIGYDETFEKLQMEELADKIDQYIQDGIDAGAMVN